MMVLLLLSTLQFCCTLQFALKAAAGEEREMKMTAKEAEHFFVDS